MLTYIWKKVAPNFAYDCVHYKLTGANYVCRIFKISPRRWDLYIDGKRGIGSFFRMRFDSLKSAKRRAEIIFGTLEGGDQL